MGVRLLWRLVAEEEEEEGEGGRGRRGGGGGRRERGEATMALLTCQHARDACSQQLSFSRLTQLFGPYM